MSQSINIKQTTFYFLILVLVFSVVFLFISVRSLEKKILMYKPIVVLDTAQYIKSLNPLDASKSEIYNNMEKMNTDIAKLKKSGFIVLQKHSILAAPDDIILNDNDL